MKAEYGNVDILINAGVHNAMPNGFESSPRTTGKMRRCDLHAHFQLVHQFLPEFEAQGSGCIIHFTTIAGTVGLGLGKQRHPPRARRQPRSPNALATSSKKGIRSNVIQIGYVRAPRQPRRSGGQGRYRRCNGARSSLCRGKQSTPEEVANVAAFLCSDKAAFINGSDIFVDGGSAGCTYGP